MGEFLRREQQQVEMEKKQSAGSSLKLRSANGIQCRPHVTPIDPNENPKRKKIKHPVAQVPVPVFPNKCQEQVGAGTTGVDGDRAIDRRRELADALRAHAVQRSAHIGAVSSKGVNLADIEARLSAPSLTCDWRQQVFAEDTEEGDLLEVELAHDVVVPTADGRIVVPTESEVRRGF